MERGPLEDRHRHVATLEEAIALTGPKHKIEITDRPPVIAGRPFETCSCPSDHVHTIWHHAADEGIAEGDGKYDNQYLWAVLRPIYARKWYPDLLDRA